MIKTKLALALFVAMTLAAATGLPHAFAAEELIVNGGFETGNFKGWDAPCQVAPYFGSCAVVSPSVQAPYGYRYEFQYDTPTAQPHSGNYSARIGTTAYSLGIGGTGSLSQNVTVPAKSRATVTFWYRVEKGAKLELILKGADGSVIRQRTFEESPGWTLFKHELGAEYAGKTVSLVFQGTAYSENSQRYETVNLGDSAYTALVTFKQSYYTYIDLVSVVAEPA